MSAIPQDLAKLPYKQLKSLASQVGEAMKASQRATAARIAQIAEDTDIRLDELKTLTRKPGQPVTARTGNGTHAAPETRKPTVRKAKSAKKTAHKPGTVQYRDPENPKLVWTGRGPKPKWMVARIAAGASQESLRAA